MTLGKLLLFGAANRTRRHVPAQGDRPGGARPAWTDGGGSNPGGSDVVILFPAFGFPAMVDGTRTAPALSCLLLARPSFSEDPANIEAVLKYQSWPAPGDPIADASTLRAFSSGSVQGVGSRSLDELLQAKGVLGIEGMGGQGRLSEELLKAYQSKGYQKVVWCSITLPAAVQTDASRPPIYNLVVVGEDAVLREMIQAIPLPHEGCPRGDDTKTPQGRDVRPLHPFCLFNRDYLNVAHLTDLHTACRWELMERRIQASYPQLTGYFNNLNQRLREQLQGIGAEDDIHMAVMTGDLVDYNRGHDGTDENSLDANYAFNRNWTLLYEIMMENYQRPLFTVAGNHDWRLNPYAPVPQFLEQLFREEGTISPPLFVILLALLIAGAGTGVFTGLSYAGFYKVSKGDSDWIAGGIAFALLALQWTPSMLAILIAILEAWAHAAGTGLLDVWWLWLVMYGLSLVIGGITTGILAGRGVQDDLGEGAGQGALWGTAVGGGVAALLIVVLLILKGKQMNEVPPYVFLTPEEAEQVIPEDFHKTDMVGVRGTLRSTELALRWYSLAINPFLDYYFRFRNMSFVMLDWNQGENLLQSSPPVASWSLSEEQWQLVQRWALGASSSTAALLSMHATTFSPRDGVNLETLRSDGMAWDDSDIARSTVEWHRGDLIRLLRETKARAASVLALSGHTHLNDVFQFEGDEQVFKQDQHTVSGGTTIEYTDRDDAEAFFLTTTCTDPLGTKDGRVKEARKPSRREIKFGADGRVSSLDIGRLTPPPEIRDEVAEG